MTPSRIQQPRTLEGARPHVALNAAKSGNWRCLPTSSYAEENAVAALSASLGLQFLGRRPKTVRVVLHDLPAFDSGCRGWGSMHNTGFVRH
jgi:hypothetical protein